MANATLQDRRKTIKIPTSEKLEMLIASSGRILSIKLTISKETGLRPIELHNLKVKDIDLDQKIIYPTTAEHGSGRRLKINNTTNDRSIALTILLMT